MKGWIKLDQRALGELVQLGAGDFPGLFRRLSGCKGTKQARSIIGEALQSKKGRVR
jgi:hypothetical protein